MFSVCVCVCIFLCLCTGRGLATSLSPVQGVLSTVPDQETEETQPDAPKAGASSQVWEQRGRKKIHTTLYSFTQVFGLHTQSQYKVLCLLVPTFTVSIGKKVKLTPLPN
jgi:hypothetical protein